MIYFYKGAKGKGKTLTLVKDALMFKKDGYTVYSNMKSIKFAKYLPNEEILKINKNTKLDNCVLIIDEIQTLFNARRSSRKENVDFSHFLQQIRKRKIELLATAQYSNTVDLIFRQHVDYIINPSFDKELLVCKVVYTDLNSIEDDINGMQGEPIRTTVVFDAREIFGLYDTEELVV